MSPFDASMDDAATPAGRFSWATFLAGLAITAVLGTLCSVASAAIGFDRHTALWILFWTPMLAGMIPGVVVIVLARRRRSTGYIIGGIAGMAVTSLVACVAGVISMCGSAVSQ